MKLSLIKSCISRRRLILEMSWQDFRRRFAGSALGALWGILDPLLTMSVYYLVFRFGFRSGDVGDTPFVLWFFCGFVAWIFFSQSFAAASNSLLEYGYLVKKVVFPLELLPLIKIFSCLYVQLIFIALLSALCCVFGVLPSLYWLQLPYYLLCSVLLLYALCLGFASVNVYLRDMRELINVLLLIGMWGTPIAWQPEILPESLRPLLTLSPINYIVDGYRGALISHVWLWEKPVDTAVFWLIMLLMIIAGKSIYLKLRAGFADFI